jgi:hypothetical protein
MAFTRERTIEITLSRWSRHGYCPNLTLSPHEPVEFLLPGERHLARVEASSGEQTFITNQRLFVTTAAGRVAIPFEDVRSVHWLTTRSLTGLNTEDVRTMKGEHAGRLIVERQDDSQIVIDRLGRAVFPLLQVLQFVIRHRRMRKNTFPWYTWPFAYFRARQI